MRKRNKALFRFRVSAVFLALFLAACAGDPAEQSEDRAQTEGDAGDEPVYHLTDYKTRAEGGAVPIWVEYYLEGNIAALEALEEYQDRYAFIARSRGTNSRALEQWLRGFSVELDFARLAAMRIEKRFTQAALGFPDTVFGRYFEALIRAVSDASWEGAVREDDFWLKGFYQGVQGAQGTDGNTAGNEGGESYDFMILVTVDKTLLASRIQSLLFEVKPQAPMSRDQLAAVERLRERFFEGF
jgi:hypothetical protein